MRELTPEELAGSPLGFADAVLGLPGNYPWQDKAIAPLMLARGQGARRINISVVTPNGSGKDSRIIPQAAYWWVATHRRGRCVITSKSDLQLTEQTIPAIERHKHKFEKYESIESPRYELTTPTGGKIIAFVTNSAARVEGWHKEDDIDGPLLLIVNEAKSVDEEIFMALDRCTPNALMLLSSPGLKQGRFFDSHTKLCADYITIRAGLTDCPHVPKERIEYVIKTYGENHPITRSTLYGEFMEQDDDTAFCVPNEALEQCLNNPPPKRTGFVHVFCDFAEGGAQNVIVRRDGNYYEIIDAWRETNEDAVVGKFIQHFRKLNLKPEQITGDAAGKAILDKLALAGWQINRKNFGAPAFDKDNYKSWCAEAWIEGGNKIKNREVIIPDNPELKAQLTTRKKMYTNTGKMAVEDKYLMKKDRNLPSPDLADALFGAMHAQDLTALYGKQPFTWDDAKDYMDRSHDSALLESIGAAY